MLATTFAFFKQDVTNENTSLRLINDEMETTEANTIDPDKDILEAPTSCFGITATWLSIASLMCGPYMLMLANQLMMEPCSNMYYILRSIKRVEKCVCFLIHYSFSSIHS